MNKKIFVIEYLKDYNSGRACIVAGYSPGDADDLLADPEISKVIVKALDGRMELANIDAAWIMQQLIENHYLARQDGKYQTSNQAIIALGKLAGVDAFAAQKIELSTDKELAERLERARGFD